MSTVQTHEEFRERLWSAHRSRGGSALREQLIDEYRDLAYNLLHRMGRRCDEDLERVALIGLMKAVDRFDPVSGNAFSSFAVPTIVGEIKRYLRDQSRLVRPTRSLLDVRVRVRAKEAELTATTGRSPSVAELAETLGLDLERVVEAMAMEERCHPCSLDALARSTDAEQPMPLAQCLGSGDVAGLLPLLGAARWLRQRGARVVVVAGRERTARLLACAGIDRVLPGFPTEEAAAAAQRSGDAPELTPASGEAIGHLIQTLEGMSTPREGMA